jgi:hypothetical protein
VSQNAADGDLMHLNVLDDLANLIFMGAYWVKDILWLRLLAIVGSLWSSRTIHATRAWGIVNERRPVAFTGDEQLLYDKHSVRCRPTSSNAVELMARGLDGFIENSVNVPRIVRRVQLPAFEYDIHAPYAWPRSSSVEAGNLMFRAISELGSRSA